MRKQQAFLCGDTHATRCSENLSVLRRAIVGVPVAGLLFWNVLAGTAQASTNGQHVIVNGHAQNSVLMCGTNQRGERICETFNTPGTSTPDPNNWWWVGTASIKGWTGLNETGRYLGEVHCDVPRQQSGGDSVTCNTGW